MNTRDLHYLLALNEHRHFGKAAQACFVSQPALSMQIKRLEENLGVKLLERNNKAVLFTEVGLAICKRASQILLEVSEIRELAKSAQNPYQGELKLGIIPTLASSLLPLIIPPLSKEFPTLHFYLIEEQTALLSKKLKTGGLDAAFLALPLEEKSDIIAAGLFEEEFLLAVPPNHRLAKQHQIKENDLSKESLLLLEEGHCMHGQTMALCQKMQAQEIQNFRATSLETLRQMVTSGNAITLIPELAKQLMNNITYIPFAAPKPTRSIALCWRASSVKAALLADIVMHIKKIIAKKNLKILD